MAFQEETYLCLKNNQFFHFVNYSEVERKDYFRRFKERTLLRLKNFVNSSLKFRLLWLLD
jgi:hypothetical protein